MNKIETKKLLNIIKGYYNSLFYIDEYVLTAWSDDYKNYDLEDCIEHLKTYLKENPDIPPKPHTFKRGLLTAEEKKKIKNREFIIECNLCHRWMSLEEYDNHYGKCLDTEYLIGVAKKQGKELPREDLESAKPEILNKLLQKYAPEKVDWYDFR